MLIRLFSKYEIKILNKEFDTGFFKCKKTAVVTFYSDDKKEVIKYGYLDNEYIFDILKTHQEIQLDNCYIKNFKLDLFKGDHLAIIGPSGCGKTTIAKTIVNMLPEGSITKGLIKISGEDFTKIDKNNPLTFPFKVPSKYERNIK